MRGQAAMEYLFTYGWALFIVVIVLALIIGTGLFSSSWFTPNECVFQPDFTCNSFILFREADQSKLSAVLHNGLGFGIRIIAVRVTTNNMGEEGEHEWIPSPMPGPASLVVPNGGAYNLTMAFSGPSQPLAGSTKTAQVSLEYVNCVSNSTYCVSPYGTPDPKDIRYITGKITSRIEQK